MLDCVGHEAARGGDECVDESVACGGFDEGHVCSSRAEWNFKEYGKQRVVLISLAAVSCCFLGEGLCTDFMCCRRQ